MRTLVVWCPDWPVVAAASVAGLPFAVPMAVVAANRVVATSAVARSEGVRRGMRRREAQGKCPELVVFDDDPERDARLFEAVAAAVEELAVGVEVVRPGVVAVPAQGPAGYFGGEEGAAERLMDQVAVRAEVESQVGVAEGLFAATLAARRGVLVEPGRSAEFLAPLSVAELHQPGGPDRTELIDLLRRLGLRTLGAFASLSERDVLSRFDADAMRAHRLARGLEERPPARRRPPPDLSVRAELDPPVERVDAAAFAAKSLADRLHAGLAAHGLACTRLGIYALSERDEELGRVWRCAEPLTPNGIADRVRWQLDGWLRTGGPTSGLRSLWLEPEEVVEGRALQLDLWRGQGYAEAEERAARAMVRVQGLLGPEGVTTPVLEGGRDPVSRVRLVPWGEDRQSTSDPDLPWPGRLPAPSPAVVFRDLIPAELFDEHNNPVHLTARHTLTAPPTTIRINGGPPRHILAHAGPWLTDPHWWTPPTPPPSTPTPPSTHTSTPPRTPSSPPLSSPRTTTPPLSSPSFSSPSPSLPRTTTPPSSQPLSSPGALPPPSAHIPSSLHATTPPPTHTVTPSSTRATTSTPRPASASPATSTPRPASTSPSTSTPPRTLSPSPNATPTTPSPRTPSAPRATTPPSPQALSSSSALTPPSAHIPSSLHATTPPPTHTTTPPSPRAATPSSTHTAISTPRSAATSPRPVTPPHTPSAPRATIPPPTHTTTSTSRSAATSSRSATPPRTPSSSRTITPPSPHATTSPSPQALSSPSALTPPSTPKFTPSPAPGSSPVPTAKFTSPYASPSPTPNPAATSTLAPNPQAHLQLLLGAAPTEPAAGTDPIPIRPTATPTPITSTTASTSSARAHRAPHSDSPEPASATPIRQASTPAVPALPASDAPHTPTFAAVSALPTPTTPTTPIPATPTPTPTSDTSTPHTTTPAAPTSLAPSYVPAPSHSLASAHTASATADLTAHAALPAAATLAAPSASPPPTPPAVSALPAPTEPTSATPSEPTAAQITPISAAPSAGKPHIAAVPPLPERPATPTTAFLVTYTHGSWRLHAHYD